MAFGGFGSIESTPTGRVDNLPTILIFLKNYPKSRSVSNFLQQLDLGPKQHKRFCLPAKAPASCVFGVRPAIGLDFLALGVSALAPP
jgi:hypothetical protein